MSQAASTDQKIVQEDKRKEYKDRIVIRSYSSMILLIPSFITALVCGIIQLILNRARALPLDEQLNGHMSIIGVIFFVIFVLNIFLIAFDFCRIQTILLVVVFVATSAILLLVNAYTDFITRLILPFIPEIRIWLSTDLYFLFALLFGLILLFTWVGTFFNYYVIDGNELIHRQGWGAGVERYHAANMRVTKEVPDLIEALFFRSATLILNPAGVDRALVLKNVLFANKKLAVMNEILSRLKVDID